MFHSPGSKIGPRRKALFPNGQIIFANNNGQIGNSNFVWSGSKLTIGNTTSNAVINSNAILIGAINTTAVGVSLANNLITVGNSSINNVINSTAFMIASNLDTVSVSCTSIIVGNSTVNNVINSTAFMIGNIGSSIVTSCTSITVGNSTVNSMINATGIVIGNATVNTFVVNTYISGNGYGITSITASVVANSGIVSNATGIYANIGSGLSFVSGAITATATGGSPFGQI